MIKCEICGKEFKRIGQHIRMIHKMSSQSYYDKYIKEDFEGICLNESCSNLTSFIDVRNGYRKYCSTLCQGILSSKRSFEKIEVISKKRNYKLLTKLDEYKNQFSKLKFRCPEGHICWLRADGFISGSECQICANKKRGEKTIEFMLNGGSEKASKRQRTSFEEIIETVEKQGYELLSSKERYQKNLAGKLEVKCPKGHIFKTFLGGPKSIIRCRKCYIESCRIPFEKIIKYVEEQGYKLLTTKEKYEKEFPKKLWFRCSEGHEWPTQWSSFKNSGSRCPICARKEQARKMRLRKIKKIEFYHGKCYPNYNHEGCKLIDEYGKEHDYNFQHAENGGEYHIKELGYWVDAYDKIRNTVLEIDEPVHYDKNGNLKKRDLERQKEITDFLGCKFIRLKI